MIQNKKILFVHNGTGLGGAPKALQYIIKVCVNAGYTCYVACSECSQTIPYFKEAGADIIIVDSFPCYTNSTTLSYGVNSLEFKKERAYSELYVEYWLKIINQNHYDIVFINSMSLCDLIKPSKCSGCKVIQVIRETAKCGESFEIMKSIISDADAVIFISEYDQKLFSIDSKNVNLIPDAVDPEKYISGSIEKKNIRRKNNISDNDIVLLFTGGDGFIKGGELLLRVLLKVKSEKPITLIYAGYKNRNNNNIIKHYLKVLLSLFIKSRRFNKEKVNRLLLRLNRKKNINIKALGYVQDIEEYFKIADICMIPYVIPHQALPIIEAGMAKVPCLVSEHDCFKYEIINDINGYLLPINNIYAWIEAINKLVHDDEKRIYMGINNYHNAMLRHDMNNNNKKLLSVLGSI